MKRSFFLTVFCVTQLFFIVVYIHKSNRYTQQSYRCQELELAYKKLEEQKQFLVHQLYVAKDQNELKLFAQQKLGMTVVDLKHVKQLQSHD